MAKLYSEIDKSILVSIPNPSKEAYEIKIKIPEFTFLGVKELTASEPDIFKDKETASSIVGTKTNIDFEPSDKR